MLVVALQISSGHNLPPAKDIVYVLISLIVAVTIHELMHAYTAWRLGDSTARDLGRITLNPVAHFDPFGFFGMVLITLGFFFIGWGKPVPVTMSRLTPVLGQGFDGRKRAMAVVAIAGPISNVVQAAAGAGIIRFAQSSGMELGEFGYFLATFVYINIILAAFNLIPVPPLDGYRILVGILPSFWYRALSPLERHGFIILFVMIWVTDMINAPSIVFPMVSPTQSLLYRMLF